jgi:hypothetical protein
MSADYKTQALKVCASATGGADVDVSATLFVDGTTSQAGDITLVDVHKAEKCGEVTARASSGQAKLRLIYVVVPLVGNGDFVVTVTLKHNAVPIASRVISKSGDVSGGPKTFSLTFKLP